MSAPDIFLSYNREDVARARQFADAFKAEGFDLWWDAHLKSGEAYDKVTEDALIHAKAVVVLWSKKSVESRWVRSEATVGERNGTLAPAMIEACQRPVMFELTQTAELSHWRGNRADSAWRAFVADLRELVGREAPAGVTSGQTFAKAPRFALNRRNLLIGGGGIASLGLLSLLGLHLTGSSGAAAGVAVLPFRNLTGDPQKDYLSAGLAEELRSMLSRNHALRIVARVSSEAVAERQLEAVSMADELSVSHLLDGSLRQTQAGLAIAIELINGETGFADWSEDFEGSVKDILVLQRGILGAVNQALSQEYQQSEDDAAGGTNDAAAFDAYLQGLALFRSAVSTETDLAALDLYDRAITLDPAFGNAHAARARALVALGNTSADTQAAQDYYATAAQAAQVATTVSPSSADAQATFGFVLFQAQLKVAEAREPYEQSYALGQGNATIVGRYGLYAAQTGRHDAAAMAMESALSLDPLNPTVLRGVGFAKYAAGDFLGANEMVAQALALNSRLRDSHARIGMGLIMLGKPQEAVEVASNEVSALVRETCLAIAHGRLGNRDAAEAARTALIDQYGDSSMYQQAQILAAWGRPSAAMEALNRAFDLQDSGLTYLKIDPFLDSLRERPDFSSLLRTLGYD